MRLVSSSILMAAVLATSAMAAAPTGSAPAVVANPPAYWEWQSRPAMGWNSWDCYGAGVNEEQTFANADYMKKNLLEHGYNLVTIDIQWYEPLAHTGNYRRGAVLEMDANGRLLPAPNRFPSTKESRSFKPVGDKLHAMGFQFGLHLMRGIPRQAVDRDNVVILGTEKLKEGGVHAADIVNKSDVCGWNTDMYGVDMSKPGAQEYYDSVFAQMASWGLDFVKVDDLSAPRFHGPETEAIRKAIDKTGRKIVFSTSPGATPVASGPQVQVLANQWRVSNDFWDNWGALQSQFTRLDAWTPYRGPGHFPDADMLPVGRLEMWTNENGPNPGRNTRFAGDELFTLMNLWCIARSPLIIGADLPHSDDFTLALLTNDEVLKVNQHSTNNRQLMREGDKVAWVADAEGSANKYVALFNAPAAPARGRRGGPGGATASAPASAAAAPGPLTVRVPVADLKIDPAMKVTAIRDLWGHLDLPAAEAVTAELGPHASAIFEIRVEKR
jgi:alpha-galactosidase